MEPVTHGRVSGNTSLPSNAFATPAPSRSATSVSSATQPRAPCPTSIATFPPALSRSAAARTAPGSGVGMACANPTLDGTCLNACAGGSYGRSSTSEGKMMHVGACSVTAIRIARSIRFGSCCGTVHICT